MNLLRLFRRELPPEPAKPIAIVPQAPVVGSVAPDTHQIAYRLRAILRDRQQRAERREDHDHLTNEALGHAGALLAKGYFSRAQYDEAVTAIKGAD